MDIRPTRHGLRLSQHGVVISELRTCAGPTHSVFDVLAALMGVLEHRDPVALLGFAGGGMMAPLAHLGYSRCLHAVDLDAASHALFAQHCPHWHDRVRWTQGDALTWLQRQRRQFGLLVEDLSIPSDGDVFKPEICWDSLPALIRQKMHPDGIVIFNLLKPRSGPWSQPLRSIPRLFGDSRLVLLEEFENRILVCGRGLPSARALGSRLRGALEALRSRQAGRFRVRGIPA